MIFKNFNSSNKIDKDYVEYVADWLQKRPGAKVAVGTDSKTRSKKGKKTIFVTAIVMYIPGPDGFNAGAHVIYTETTKKRIYENLFEKLWTELDMTKVVAERLKDEIEDINIEVHVDVNPNEAEGSYVAYPAAIGMFTGMGYKVLAKPYAPAASCAGDYMVNR